jgi:hypothetical protein
MAALLALGAVLVALKGLQKLWQKHRQSRLVAETAA